MTDPAATAFEQFVAFVTREVLPSFESMRREAVLAGTRCLKNERARLREQLDACGVRVPSDIPIAELRELADRHLQHLPAGDVGMPAGNPATETAPALTFESH